METYIKSLLGEDVTEEHLMNFRKIITYLVRTKSDEVKLVDGKVPLKSNLFLMLVGKASTGKSAFVEILKHYFSHCYNALPTVFDLKNISCLDTKSHIYLRLVEGTDISLHAFDYVENKQRYDPTKLPLKRFITTIDELPWTESAKEWQFTTPVKFVQNFKPDDKFVENFIKANTRESFREYFNVPVSVEEIDGLSEYFRKNGLKK